MAFNPTLPLRSGVVLSPDLTGSADVFPLLRGAKYAGKKAAWSTTTLQSKSGRVFGLQNWTYPIWRFSVSYETLSQDPARRDLDRLFAAFNRRAGQAGHFYFFDPYDNVVKGQTLATGDGVTTAFEFVRSFETWKEPVFAFNGRPIVTVGGVVVTNYDTLTPGVLRFTSPPGAGQVIAWSGSFFFLCRFTQDELGVEQMSEMLYSSDGVAFETKKL